MRRPFEDQRDLGDAPAEALAGTQVEGDTRPAAGVDLQGDRGEGLGRGVLGEAGLLFEAANLLAALPAGGVLTPSRVLRQRLDVAGGGENLGLLGL